MKEKVIRVLEVKQNTKDYILPKKSERYFRINKTTRTLFRNQKAVHIGVCHDVGNLSYDNDL